MIDDSEKECAALEESRKAAQEQLENWQELLKEIKSQYCAFTKVKTQTF